MAREIVIDFVFREDQEASYEIHRIRNFGEDVHRACEADGWASMSWAHVDQATHQLRVVVRSKRRVRRIAALINGLLEKHFLTNQARLSNV